MSMGTNAIETQKIDKKAAALATPPTEASPRLEALSRFLSRSFPKTALFLALDVVTLIVSHSIAETGVREFLRVPVEALNPPGYVLFYLPFFAAILYLFEGYHIPELRRPEKELALVFKAVSFSFLALICANFVFFKQLGFSRYLMVSWYLLALVFLLCSRFGLRAFYAMLWRQGLAQQRTLLVGPAAKLDELQKLLSIQRYQGYRILGTIPYPNHETGTGFQAIEFPVLGSLDHWEEVASKSDAQLMVICPPSTSSPEYPMVMDILRRCRLQKIDVEVYSDLFSSTEFHYELDEYSGFLRVHAVPPWPREVQLAVKTVLDWLIGLVGSFLTVLVTPLIAMLIKLEDGGPILYRSPFLGQDGKAHYYWKFRTMCIDADQVLAQNSQLRRQFEKQYKLADDPRVTRLGRFLRKYSLDELPQFFSVLRGELSFVGPRTIREEEGARYGPLLPKLLSVKPGVTGFWQVMGRQTTTYEERVQMDMFYIDRWSIWLDLLIIAKTFWKVLRAEGAY